MPRRSATPSSARPTYEATLISLANQLISAAASSPVSEVKRIIKAGAPTWYQEDTMGWSALHFAAERADSQVVKALLDGGAVWNAMDLLGHTAADISLSVNDSISYILIRNEGLRSEMLHHAIVSSKPPPPPPTTTTTPSLESSAVTHQSSTQMTLRQTDTTSAGDNLAFLRSKLVWEVGDDGKERVLDADGNGVMMGWEEPLMKEHVRLMCEERSRGGGGESLTTDDDGAGKGLSILNVGFGLGIIDRLFQSLPTKPLNHIIIEAHPQVLSYIRSTGFDQLPGVKVLPGRWQDWLTPDRIGEVLSMTATPSTGKGKQVVQDEGKAAAATATAENDDDGEEQVDWEAMGSGFDAIFVDTFAEGYEDLKSFFEFLPDLLNGPSAVFSFWNGLGATDPSIYDVASNLAELHLEEVGMKVTYHPVLIPSSMSFLVWRGVRRRYWDLPVYRLPIARMDL